MKSLANLALEEIHPFILFHCRFQVNWWQSFSPSLLSNSPSSKQQRFGKQLQTPSHHHWHWLRQFAHLECTSSKRIKFLIRPHHLSAWSSWPCLLKSWWALHTSLSQAFPLQGYKTLTTFFLSFNHITPGSTRRLIEIIVVKEISKAIVKVSMDRLFTGSQLREKSRRTASNTVPYLTENKLVITKKKKTHNQSSHPIFDVHKVERSRPIREHLISHHLRLAWAGTRHLCFCKIFASLSNHSMFFTYTMVRNWTAMQ